MVGEKTPKPASMRRPAPECAGEWVAKHLDQVCRRFRVLRAKTEAVQIKSRTAGPGKSGPVSVNLFEEGARGICAVVRSHNQVQPTSEIGIRQGHARDVTVVQIFKAVQRCGVDPAGAGWRYHDKHGSFEPARPLQFFQRKLGARFYRVRGSQSDIDANRLER